MRQAIYSRRSRRWHDEEGISLVELLMSVFILGLVMSAFAASLITMLRTTSKNEQDVRATAIAQQSVERLQAVEWDSAALYADEVQAQLDATTPWATRIDPGTTDFEGEEVLVLPGPGTDPREAKVIAPSETQVVGNLTYTVDRYVTFVDRDGNGAPDTRRFTTFVSWVDRFDVYREVRIDSERVPNQEEAAATFDGLRVLEFIVSPDPVTLDSVTAMATSTITVSIRTNRPTTNGHLTWERLAIDDDVDPVVTTKETDGEDMVGSLPATVDGYLGNTRWTLSLPADETFFNGFNEFTFTADDADIYKSSITAKEAVKMLGGPHDDPAVDEGDPGGGDPGGGTPAAVTVVQITGPTPSICVNNGNNKNSSNLNFTVQVHGIAAGPPVDGAVSVQYVYRQANSEQVSSGSTTVTYASFNGTNTIWTYTIDANSRRWQPGDTVVFTFTAARDSDAGNGQGTYSVQAATC